MARKVGLAVEDVVDAAVAVAEAEGLEAVTLARVAATLGVRPPSLYSHVDGVAGLRRAVSLRAAAALGQALAGATDGRGGADGLRALAHAYRAFAVGHPGLYASLLPTPSADDDPAGAAAFAAPVATVAAVFHQLGVAEADLVALVRAFRSCLHGFVSLEVGGGFGLPVDVDASFNALVDLVVAGIVARAALG